MQGSWHGNGDPKQLFVDCVHMRLDLANHRPKQEGEMLINQMPSEYHAFRDHTVRASSTDDGRMTALVV